MTQKVLLVEDDRLIGEGLRVGLGQRDFRVRWIQTGDATFQEVSSEVPDVIVLDLGLPDIDGTLVLSLLRERGHHI